MEIFIIRNVIIEALIIYIFWDLIFVKCIDCRDNTLKSEVKQNLTLKDENIYDNEDILQNIINNTNNKIYSDIINAILDESNIDKENVVSLTPLKEGESLSSQIINEEFLNELDDLDWQIVMEKIYHSIWYHWNNKFYSEFSKRVPTILREMRKISSKLGISILDKDEILGLINRLNPKTKTVDSKLSKLSKKIFNKNPDDIYNTSNLKKLHDIQYKRAEEAIINIIVEMKGYIRIFLKLIDIKASQAGLLFLNHIQGRSYSKIAKKDDIFRNNIRNCPIQTAFNYRYVDENLDLLMHHEKGFGIWNLGELNKHKSTVGSSSGISKKINGIIDFVYSEFITPSALIVSAIEDATLLHGSLSGAILRSFSSSYNIPLLTTFESLTKATFFFIKQIDIKLYKILH
ncbi:hypothetical protein cand_010250 [Cryptosporidium andersoni]|uniref:Uncharacterized protein n=1 Tax=Cryptosporidium andersoni TaxID=117008 RepID=A0A1J4MI91_9CRYT|nr:hypothetical protein cand_010250 [Cryptosporidium andersoni]